MARTHTIRLTIDGQEYDVIVGEPIHGRVEVTVNGRPVLVELTAPPGVATRPAASPVTADVHDRPSPASAQSQAPTNGRIVAPMPGSIHGIRVTPGQRIERGNVVCFLEAMKMNNTIYAPAAGVIRDVAVSEGQVVSYGEVLLVYAD